MEAAQKTSKKNASRVRKPRQSNNPFAGTSKNLFAYCNFRSYKFRKNSTTAKLAQAAVEDTIRENRLQTPSHQEMEKRRREKNLEWADTIDEKLEDLKAEFDPFHPSKQRFHEKKRYAVAQTFPHRYFSLQDKRLQCGLCNYKRPDQDPKNDRLLTKHLAVKHKIYSM